MESQYKNLLNLLGACLARETWHPSEDVQWEKLEQLSQIHSVAGFLGYMAMKASPAPSPEVRARLRGLCMNTIMVFSRRMAMAEDLAAVLAEVKIDHILMKGFEIRNFYPVPELRTFNDIDIVIRPEDRQRSHEKMLELGFQVHADWEPVYSYVRGEEHYEFHTQIMEIDDLQEDGFQAYFQNMWQYAREISPHSYRFGPEYHFLYLLAHIAKHVHHAGAGIRMYLDVAAFLGHYGGTMDWNWIESQLRLMELERFAAVVMAAVEKWFGVKCPLELEKISEEILDEFTEFTMEAGVFGHVNRDPAMAKLKNETSRTVGTRMRKALRRTFPDAKSIEKRYVYLQHKPWLLPVAWVHRVVKNKEKLGQKTREMQNIIGADSAQVQKLQRLMRNIGL